MNYIDDRLQLLSQLQTGSTLIVGRKNHSSGGKYYATLVLDGDNGAGLMHTYTHKTNYEAEVENCTWFPAAFGDTPQEALDKLNERLKSIVISSATILKWTGDVTAIERELCKAPDSQALAGCSFLTMAQEG